MAPKGDFSRLELGRGLTQNQCEGAMIRGTSLHQKHGKKAIKR